VIIHRGGRFAIRRPGMGAVKKFFLMPDDVVLNDWISISDKAI
jgi:hypothetical protein